MGECGWVGVYGVCGRVGVRGRPFTFACGSLTADSQNAIADVNTPCLLYRR